MPINGNGVDCARKGDSNMRVEIGGILVIAAIGIAGWVLIDRGIQLVKAVEGLINPKKEESATG